MWTGCFLIALEAAGLRVIFPVASIPENISGQAINMNPQIISAAEFYGTMIPRRTAEDLNSIAHLKRFLELITGDSKFRKQINANPTSANSLAKKRGIDVDLSKFSSKFEAEAPVSESKTESPELPLAVLWKDWIADLFTFRRLIREDGYSNTADQRFNEWRKRQEERVKIEFGANKADAITHPIFSFELSKGCSVGCWFCGFSAESFKGHYQRTPKNVLLWRSILGTAVELFGPAAQTGFCYGATEPFDNPNYLDFLEDYLEIVGVLPQTTSATPMRDLVWTRRLMQMQKLPPALPSRFSIISPRTLKELHATFSPEELLRYELLMQLRGSSYGKARAGKTLKKVNAEGESNAGLQVNSDESSIACVSGFLVNMVDRTIYLVSPCQASDRWPLGYRVHASGTFAGAKDFGDFIERSISERMPLELPSDLPVSYREALTYEQREDGFDLFSDYSVHSFTGPDHIRRLGDMIAEGKHQPADIVGVLVDIGADIFGIMGTLTDLYRKGFLEDMPGGTGADQVVDV